MCRSSCYHHLRRIRQLRHLLDSSSLPALVVAFVLGRLDYCNRLYTLAARRLFLQGLWTSAEHSCKAADWNRTTGVCLNCRSWGIFTGFPYRVGYNTSYVCWCMTSCMVPHLATSGICVVHVEVCHCIRDRVHIVPSSRLSLFPAQGPGTHYWVMFAMPILEQLIFNLIYSIHISQIVVYNIS